MAAFTLDLHQIALETFSPVAHAAQCQNFPSSPRGCYENARSRRKVTLHRHQLPVEKAAQIVFRRRALMRMGVVFRGDRVQIVRAQTPQPEALMHHPRKPNKAVEPAVGAPEVPHPAPTYRRR
jgi:hypothetical protein